MGNRSRHERLSVDEGLGRLCQSAKGSALNPAINGRDNIGKLCTSSGTSPGRDGRFGAACKQALLTSPFEKGGLRGISLGLKSSLALHQHGTGLAPLC